MLFKGQLCINNSEKLEKIHVQVDGWLSAVCPQSLLHSFFDLFSELNHGTWGSWLRFLVPGHRLGKTHRSPGSVSSSDPGKVLSQNDREVL